MPPEIRWTVGCLVGAVSIVGLLILVLLVAIALSPPAWVQVLLGVGLALGGAAFTWLVATALGQKDPGSRHLSPIPPPEKENEPPPP
jgi:phosphate/sulfate permease